MISATHLHAILIHFPIALIIVGFLTEIIHLFSKKEFFKNVAFYLLLLGTFGTIAAYTSGSYAGEGIEEGPLKNPMELHENAALITLCITIITALFRVLLIYFNYKNGWVKYFNFFLFLVLTVSVAYTGYLGGQLVYSHGVGVELALPDFGNL